MPPQSRKDCNLNQELYLASRTSLDGEHYFELRRRHLTKKFAVGVILKNKKQIRLTGASENVFSDAKHQEVDNETIKVQAEETQSGKSRPFPTLPTLLN